MLIKLWNSGYIHFLFIRNTIQHESWKYIKTPRYQYDYGNSRMYDLPAMHSFYLGIFFIQIQETTKLIAPFNSKGKE